MQAKYNALVVLTDVFCRNHLNEKYRDLARAMIAVPQAPKPINFGPARHVGLRHRLYAGPTELPVRQVEPAEYSHG